MKGPPKHRAKTLSFSVVCKSPPHETVDELNNRRMALERVRAHLARADSELEGAVRFLEPRTDNEAEKDLVRAVANARTSVGDALAGEHPGTAGGVGGR